MTQRHLALRITMAILGVQLLLSCGIGGGGEVKDGSVSDSGSGPSSYLKQFGAVTRAPGGSNAGDENCLDVAVDSVGNVVCAGRTTGAFGEGNAGSGDAFVMKLSSTGGLLWVRHLGTFSRAVGGSNTGDDSCTSVDLDSSGNVYCAGYTTGSMGEANGGNRDAFVMKLSPTGAIQWITQLGATTRAAGGSNSGIDTCRDIKLDSSRNIYCAGETSGAMGEANGGSSDAFILKLNSNGVLQWVRQLGATTRAPGGSNAGSTMCNGVGIDGAGNVYCAGYTTGNLAEAAGGSNDMFFMKLNSSGVLQWVRQLGAVTRAPGGSNADNDTCESLAVDSTGNSFCGGNSEGPMGEPQVNFQDAVVVKVNTNGVLQWVTQLGSVTRAPGGNNDSQEFCTGIELDPSGNIFCAGHTNGAMAEANGGGSIFTGGVAQDIFVLKLNPSGSLQWVLQRGASTHIAGRTNFGSELTTSLALRGNGEMYLAGEAGGSIGEANGGGWDAFILKLPTDL